MQRERDVPILHLPTTVPTLPACQMWRQQGLYPTISGWEENLGSSGNHENKLECHLVRPINRSAAGANGQGRHQWLIVLRHIEAEAGSVRERTQKPMPATVEKDIEYGPMTKRAHNVYMYPIKITIQLKEVF